MISKPVYAKNKTKMSYVEYIFTHCIPTGFASFRHAIYFWIKLMQGDTSDYNYHKEKFNDSDEELFEMLRCDFWWELEDDVLPKEFLEGLMQQCEDIMEGRVELYTYESIDDLFKKIDAENDNDL